MNSKNRKRDTSSNTNENILSLAPMFLLGENDFLGADTTLDTSFNNHYEYEKQNLEQSVETFFNEHDINVDELLSDDEIDLDNDIFTAIDLNGDGYISQTELIKTLMEELNNLKTEVQQSSEIIESLGIELNGTNSFEQVSVSSTDKGYEATLEGDQDTPLYITLDDSSALDDLLTLNLVQEDGEDQLINSLIIEGIENITLDVTDDTDNESDDIVSISQLIIDDTQELSIVSEESISIGNIYSQSLETIDLTQSISGFTINAMETTSGITIQVNTIGDGTDVLNYDSDNDGILDSSLSSIALASDVQDIIEFSAQSLESSLIIQGAEVGTSDTSDKFDFSSFGISSMDSLIFTDYESNDTYCNPQESVQITSEYFEGTLIVNGVVSSQLDASNFIFS